MSYEVNFTDSTNIPPLVVEDQTINNFTSLGLPGRNTSGYGQVVAENFLHLLENFSNTVAPAAPVEGQLWYDKTPGVNQLKIYDGANWTAAGGLKKGSVTPPTATSLPGDLWVNSSTNQLYLFSGSGWVLVGPKIIEGDKTGAEPEVIVDTLNRSQTVLTQYVAGSRVAIFSVEDFTPKSSMYGFPTIKKGVTLNSYYDKYYGTAEKAEALVVTSNKVATTVPAANFLRSDITNNTYFPINVRNSAGVAIGQNTELSVMLDETIGVLYNKLPAAGIDIRINKNGAATTVLRIDGDQRVGINTLAPQEALDVTGNIVASGTLAVRSAADSTGINTGALVVDGGASVAANVNIGGTLTVAGATTISGNLIPATSQLSIGTEDVGFKEVRAGKFFGEFHGTVIGAVTGNSTGSAAKLASPTTFELDGDITAPSFEFDGSVGGLTKRFTTTLNEEFIKTKPAVARVDEADEFILSRGTEGLKKITKANFWASLPSLPVGMMAPFAGTTAPGGWLLCDGSEVKVADFPSLFSVIQYSYGDVATLVGKDTFKLPDFRGRMPLGRDNMDNGRTIPSASEVNTDGSPKEIDAGGGSADRVTAAQADMLGQGAGTESVTLTKDNLPAHQHTLKGSAGNQYYAYQAAATATLPSDTGVVKLPAGITADKAYGLPNTGGIVGAGTSEVAAIQIMPPYLTTNYIIYTGRTSN